MTWSRRGVLCSVAFITVVLFLVGVVVAATSGSNRWLGDDPMLGEFVLSFFPFVTAAVGVVLWRRWR